MMKQNMSTPGVLGWVHLQWFGGDAEAGGPKKDEQDVAGGGAGDGQKGSGSDHAEAPGTAEKTVPFSEYEKLQKRLTSLEEASATAKQREEKRQEAALREQGKYKELWEKVSAEHIESSTRLKKAESVISALLEEEMKGLPESFDRALIPEILDAADRLDWLRKMRATIQAIQPKAEVRRTDGFPLPAGTGGMSSKMTPAERLAAHYRTARK
jgi:hypothetical protein